MDERLHYHGGDLAMMLLKNEFNGCFFTVVPAIRKPGPSRFFNKSGPRLTNCRGDEKLVKQQMLKALMEEVNAADRDGAQCVAVIAFAQRDELGLLLFSRELPILVGHLERDFDRRGSVV